MTKELHITQCHCNILGMRFMNLSGNTITQHFVIFSEALLADSVFSIAVCHSGRNRSQQHNKSNPIFFCQRLEICLAWRKIESGILNFNITENTRTEQVLLWALIFAIIPSKRRYCFQYAFSSCGSTVGHEFDSQANHELIKSMQCGKKASTKCINVNVTVFLLNAGKRLIQKDTWKACRNRNIFQSL